MASAHTARKENPDQVFGRRSRPGSGLSRKAAQAAGAQLQRLNAGKSSGRHEMEFYSATVSSTMKDEATRAPGVGV